ncbi:MAG: hypothetical protein ACXVZU_04395 [Methanobacteriaceae archaeon]
MCLSEIQSEEETGEGHNITILSPIACHVFRRHSETKKDRIDPWPFQIPFKFSQGGYVLHRLKCW